MKTVLFIVMVVFLLAIIGVVIFALLRIHEGSKEAKEFNETALPAVMNPMDTKEDTVQEEGLAAIDLNRMIKEAKQAEAEREQIRTMHEETARKEANTAMPTPVMDVSLPQPQARHAAPVQPETGSMPIPEVEPMSMPMPSAPSMPAPPLPHHNTQQPVQDNTDMMSALDSMSYDDVMPFAGIEPSAEAPVDNEVRPVNSPFVSPFTKHNSHNSGPSGLEV